MEQREGPPVAFTKMCGHGNDFIVVDNLDGALVREWPEDARRWCRRKTGIGADGLLVLEAGEREDFRLRIFNSDGSEAEMCGNGSRCAASYAMKKGIAGPSMVFETLAGSIEAEVDGRDVTVRLTDVKDLKRDLKLGIGNNMVFNAFFANSGVPHAVLFAEAFRQLPIFGGPLRDCPGDAIRNIGRAVRYHPVFEPAGTNVNFVEIAGPGHIRVRTYERGVEDETLACGTGAVASAIVASEITKAGPPPVRVEMAGGTLWVDFRKNGPVFESVRLRGAVEWVFRGEIEE